MQDTVWSKYAVYIFTELVLITSALKCFDHCLFKQRLHVCTRVCVFGGSGGVSAHVLNSAVKPFPV